jgi:hypothetical protein
MSFSLREEHRLKVFENMVLRSISDPKRNELMGQHTACLGQMRNMYKILAGQPEGKTPLRRHRCRLEDNIGMELMEITFRGMDSVYLL